VSTHRTDDQLADLIRGGFERYEPAATKLPVRVSGRPRSRWAAMALVPLAGLLVTVIAIQAFRPESAFASWSAVPTDPDPALEAALLAGPGCQAPVSPDMTAEERVFAEDINSLPMVLVDQRGTSAVALFAEHRAAGVASKLCLGSHDGSGVLATSGSGSGLDAQESPSDGPMRLVGRLQLRSDGGETLTAAFGTSDASVARVVVGRTTGGDVIATVKDGYWVAWWPGDAALEQATAFGADGAEITAIAPSPRPRRPLEHRSVRRSHQPRRHVQVRLPRTPRALPAEPLYRPSACGVGQATAISNARRFCRISACQASHSDRSKSIVKCFSTRPAKLSTDRARRRIGAAHRGLRRPGDPPGRATDRLIHRRPYPCSIRASCRSQPTSSAASISPPRRTRAASSVMTVSVTTARRPSASTCGAASASSTSIT
jgi:hypothetical protein